MPTYEYVCAKCDHTFEKVQSIKDASLTICPKEDCARKPWGRGKVKRVLSLGGGLLFKGSGFYSTDYRSENYKAGAKKEAGGGSASKPAKTESKPDSKAESKPAPSTPAKND